MEVRSTSHRAFSSVMGDLARRRPGSNRAWGRWTLAFGCGYLVFLGYSIAAEVTSDRNVLVVALSLGGCALFMAVDVWFWAGVGGDGGRSRSWALPVLCALAVGLSLHSPNWLATFIYCGVLVGTCMALPWALVGLAGLVVLFLSAALGDGSILHSDLEWSVYLLSTVLAGLGAMAIRKVFEANFQLEAAREELARLAVAEERLRIARDLHDLLGHSLSLIVLKAELAGRLGTADPERAVNEIRDVERVARKALREVREAVGGYRQPGLGEELARARQALAAAGVEVHCDVAPGPLAAPIDATLAWAVREGTTNVLRHSRARWTEISLRRFEGAVRLEVVDDGVGCDVTVGGNGLRGLCERVVARQGKIEFGNRPEGGFRLAVSLPLREVSSTAASA